MERLKAVKRSTALGIALLTAIILLFMGRVMGFPVAIIIVSGRSMEPTLHVGDIVVGVKEPFKVGDIVIWCAGPTYCVVHRVVELRDGIVVTKGDNNPAPDPPVPESLVKYRVVTIVRNYEWLPVVLTVLGFYAYLNRDYFRRRRVAPGDVASLILVAFVVFNATVALLAPAYYSLEAGSLAVPRVTLRYATLSSNGSVVIALNTYNTRLVNVTQCYVSIYGSSKRYGCEARVTRHSSIVINGVPQSLLERMVEEGVGPLVISVKATILFGKLLGTYYVYPPWRKPTVNVLRNGTVVIANPNPAPLKVNVTTYVSNKPGLANVAFEERVLAPHGVLKLDLSKYKYAYVRVEYVFLGKRVAEQLKVRG